jgi:hypothetical protein
MFFSIRPIVLSLALVTIPSSTTFCSSKRSDHFACPAGGFEQASVISLASFSPSKIRGIDGLARGLAGKRHVEPLLKQALANPVDGGEAGVEGLHDTAVAPGFAGLGVARESQTNVRFNDAGDYEVAPENWTGS